MGDNRSLLDMIRGVRDSRVRVCSTLLTTEPLARSSLTTMPICSSAITTRPICSGAITPRPILPQPPRTHLFVNGLRVEERPRTNADRLIARQDRFLGDARAKVERQLSDWGIVAPEELLDG